jgi:hypothetical protein
LKTGRSRTPQRRSSAWQPLIQRSDTPSERKDLRSRNPQSRGRHVTEELSNSRRQKVVMVPTS